MSARRKILNALVLFTLLSITLVSPAYAFDGRGGEKVTIEAGQVINDDLYVGATEFVMDGTVNGDTVAFGEMVTINGTVNGDLISAAQTVVVNGTVTGSVRLAGSILFIGEKARIGEDILGGGYSLEVRKGAETGRDAVFATGQTLLAGNVSRNVIAYTGALEIAGAVKGNVNAHLGEAAGNRAGPPPTMFMRPSTVPAPIVKQGLTLDPAAKVSGNLDYTQNVDLAIPAGVVAGKVTRTSQPVDEKNTPREKTAAEKIVDWAWRTARTLITLLLIGLFLLWLFPVFAGGAVSELEARPLPSLGWGVVSYAGFFFAILLIIFITILAAIFFGVLTLGGISGSIAVLGLLALLTLIVAFVLATAFVAKIVVGTAIGKWILQRTGPAFASHRYWPMVIGVTVIVFVVAFLRFPLIPGFMGGLLDFAVVLLGLGALWLWARSRFVRTQPSVAVTPPAA